jgi:predicted translin family RNA/ssDNA-binding protein
MIDKKDFESIRKDMDGLDVKREEAISLSRELVKLSKRAIYSVHRDELSEADKLIGEMKKKLPKLKVLATFEEGQYRIAAQEYVEAALLFGIVSKKKLPSKTDLSVESEYYLLGLCDLPGELVRRAINSSIKGNTNEALFIRELLDEIYGELLKFDLRNGELRRKFDGIKYDLRKLEDLVFDLRKK